MTQTLIEKRRSWYRDWYYRNREKKMAWNARYLATNENARIAFNLRHRLRQALRRNSQGSIVESEIGCSLVFLKKYLESGFKKGMSWAVYLKGGMHLDHILPLCRFDLRDPNQFKKACHYTNLQFLWPKENRLKSSK